LTTFHIAPYHNYLQGHHHQWRVAEHGLAEKGKMAALQKLLIKVQCVQKELMECITVLFALNLTRAALTEKGSVAGRISRSYVLFEILWRCWKCQ
jgi:hypothetical protein